MEDIIKDSAVAYQKNWISPKDYLNMEWENGQRYEYWNGELVAMAGTNLAHNLIVSNINNQFKAKLNHKKCLSFQENVMLQMGESGNYFLPDVMLSCHDSDLDLKNTFLKHPSVIVEVLSDSTELYDRSKKWEQYRKIKSLRYYLLVSQNEYLVNMYHRPNESTLFSYQSFTGLDEAVAFTELGFELSLREIYDRIDLPEALPEDAPTQG